MPQNGLGTAGAIMDRLVVAAGGDELAAAASHDVDGDGDGPVRPVRREMNDAEMRRYLVEVGEHLASRGLTGEIVLAGGAIMVMALKARGGSNDIDAVFEREAEALRQAAREVADANGLPSIWLNDHVRVFVAADAPTVEFFEVPGLRVRMVRLDYLFYMKAWAGDPVDQRDLRTIAKALTVKDEHEAYDIVRRYSPGELSREVQILLESLFE
jgi:predicted nucleotidyltransferase